MCLGASELVRFQDWQKLEKKKVTELQKMNQRLIIDKEKTDKCFAEKLEILNNNLKMSESREMQQKLDFEKLDNNFEQIKKEYQNLSKIFEKITNGTEVLKQEIKQTFTLIQDLKQKLKMIETENVRLNKKQIGRASCRERV